MGTTLIDNFSYKGRRFLDERQSVATLAALKAVSATDIPDGFRTYCAADGQWYEYNSANTEDSTTGKWRPAGSCLQEPGSSEHLPMSQKAVTAALEYSGHRISDIDELVDGEKTPMSVDIEVNQKIVLDSVIPKGSEITIETNGAHIYLFSDPEKLQSHFLTTPWLTQRNTPYKITVERDVASIRSDSGASTVSWIKKITPGLSGKLATLTAALAGTDAAVDAVKESVGDCGSLKTTAKSDIVGAVNECVDNNAEVAGLVSGKYQVLELTEHLHSGYIGIDGSLKEPGSFTVMKHTVEQGKTYRYKIKVASAYWADYVPVVVLYKGDTFVKSALMSNGGTQMDMTFTVDVDADTAYMIDYEYAKAGRAQLLEVVHMPLQPQISDNLEAIKSLRQKCGDMESSFSEAAQFLNANKDGMTGLLRRNWWEGLDFTCLGDSLTEMNKWPGSGSWAWERPVKAFFSLGTFRNCGIGGTLLCGYQESSFSESGCICSWARMKAQYPEEVRESIRLALIMGGTNDFLSKQPIGDAEPEYSTEFALDADWIADTVNNPGGGDFDTRYTGGAICSAIMKLQCLLPNARVVVVTPYSAVAVSGQTPGENVYNLVRNDAGLSIFDYADTIRKYAARMSTPCIDLTSNSGVNPCNYHTWVHAQDGVHPLWSASNRNGCNQIARVIIGGLLSILPLSMTADGKDEFIH